MNRYAIAATVLLAVGTMQEADAAAMVWLLGNDLARNCRNDQDYFRSGVCAGYVMGVADMMVQPEWPYPTKACFPNEVEVGQLVAVVKKYLADHPELLHYSALSIVATALARAFPCPSR